MTIREKGYSHWQGKLRENKFPWMPITKWGIKLTFRKKFFKLLFFGSLTPTLVYLAGIYISERLEDFKFMIKGQAEFLQINPLYFKSYFTNDLLLFIIVMILIFCGAGLISDDLKYNSLQLYFSRPLRKGDYFLGKMSVIAFFLFVLTLIPGLFLLIMKLIFSGSFSFLVKYPWLPLAIIGYSFFVTGFFAVYTLSLSALSKNRRYVAIFIFGAYIFSDILFGIFYGIFKNPYFALLSLKCNLQQVGSFLFIQKTPYNFSWLYSFLILILLTVLAGYILKKRIKEVEIIK